MTSAYNPQTNGLTEKFNGTIEIALRKHVYGNEKDWPNWVDFILLAYRSKVKASTKYTPYELMFGRTINTFDRWSDESSIEEASALFQKAAEIKN